MPDYGVCDVGDNSNIVYATELEPTDTNNCLGNISLRYVLDVLINLRLFLGMTAGPLHTDILDSSSPVHSDLDNGTENNFVILTCH